MDSLSLLAMAHSQNSLSVGAWHRACCSSVQTSSVAASAHIAKSGCRMVWNKQSCDAGITENGSTSGQVSSKAQDPADTALPVVVLTPTGLSRDCSEGRIHIVLVAANESRPKPGGSGSKE